MARRDQNSFFVLLGRFTSRRGLSRPEKIFFFSLAFFLMTVADFFGESHVRTVGNFINRFCMPVKMVANSLIEIPKTISEYVDIKRENTLLRLELDALRIKNIIATGVEKELEELRRVVNLKYQSNLFDEIEKVLGFDKTVFSSYVLISMTQKSTKENAVAMTPDGIVGLIVEARGKIAKVLPVTNQKLSIPVKSKTGEHLIISGADRNEMVSREIRSNTVSELKIGDTLYTSGEGGIFKENIPVATISAINEIKNEITAKPIVDINKLNFVWVMSPVIGEAEKVLSDD